jgi:perosamine synthetase
MACTDSDEYAQRMRIMSLHGISKEAWNRFAPEGTPHYEVVAPGYKYNMTDIAAAIGIHQLRRADELHRKRRKIAALYTRLLGEIEELVLPRELPGRIHSWHLYAVRLKLDRLVTDRDEVARQLKQQGIGTSVHWMPLHMHPYYRERYGYAPEDFPVAARLYPQIITLPLFPDMKQVEVEYVCNALKTIIARSLKGRRGGQRTRRRRASAGSRSAATAISVS